MAIQTYINQCSSLLVRIALIVSDETVISAGKR